MFVASAPWGWQRREPVRGQNTPNALNRLPLKRAGARTPLKPGASRARAAAAGGVRRERRKHRRLDARTPCNGKPLATASNSQRTAVEHQP
eukprot:8156207-Lingulodinium_polyedra.AAC.1